MLEDFATIIQIFAIVNIANVVESPFISNLENGISASFQRRFERLKATTFLAKPIEQWASSSINLQLELIERLQPQNLNERRRSISILFLFKKIILLKISTWLEGFEEIVERNYKEIEEKKIPSISKKFNLYCLAAGIFCIVILISIGFEGSIPDSNSEFKLLYFLLGGIFIAFAGFMLIIKPMESFDLQKAGIRLILIIVSIIIICSSVSQYCYLDVEGLLRPIIDHRNFEKFLLIGYILLMSGAFIYSFFKFIFYKRRFIILNWLYRTIAESLVKRYFKGKEDFEVLDSE